MSTKNETPGPRGPARRARALLVAFLVPFPVLGACGGTESPAPGASQETAQAASTSEAAPVQEAPSNAAPSQAAPLEEATAPAATPSKPPGPETLDTEYDLSALSETPAAAEGAGAAEAPRTVQPPAPPKGQVTMFEDAPKSHALGTIRQGEKREHVFQMVSTGPEPLVITGVKPSCGCTKAEISLVGEEGELTLYENHEEIPVGTRFQLATEVSTEGKLGNFQAQVTLYCNRPEGPFSVQLKAEIEPVLVTEPSETVYLGKLTTADTAQETVYVKSKDEAPFMLTATDIELHKKHYPELSYVLAAVEPDAEGRASKWQIDVAVGPDIPKGMRNYPVRFSSDIPIPAPKYPNPDGTPKTYNVQLNVQAQVTGMVEANPGFISFGMVRPGEPVERVVQIQCHDDFQLPAEIPVEVQGLQGTEFAYADAFSTSVEIAQDGHADLKVRLEGMPEDMSGSFGGVLSIAVGHPWMDTLTVRFSGVCRPGLDVTGN